MKQTGENQRGMEYSFVWFKHKKAKTYKTNCPCSMDDDDESMISKYESEVRWW